MCDNLLLGVRDHCTAKPQHVLFQNQQTGKSTHSAWTNSISGRGWQKDCQGVNYTLPVREETCKVLNIYYNNVWLFWLGIDWVDSWRRIYQGGRGQPIYEPHSNDSRASICGIISSFEWNAVMVDFTRRGTIKKYHCQYYLFY